jgi:hypothetical protein
MCVRLAIVDSETGLDMVFDVLKIEKNGYEILNITDFLNEKFMTHYNQVRVYRNNQENREFYDIIREEFRKQRTTVANLFSSHIFSGSKLLDPQLVNSQTFKGVIQQFD